MFIFMFTVIIVCILVYNIPSIAYKMYQSQLEEDETYENRKKLQKKWQYKVGYTYENAIHDSCIGISIVAGIVALTILITMVIMWSPMIDEKITLYQEENLVIEQQIASVITDYQEYELGIIKECAPDQAVTMVSLYPELKSDTLVAKQIDIYLENNNKIKQLKEERINQKIIGWWFNFNAW